MLSATRLASLLKACVALAIFCWTLSYAGLSTPDYEKVLQKFKDEKAIFVEDFLSNELGGPLEGRAISQFCANRTWTHGLIFQCEPPPGGIGEVRNAHLNCIRFAMEAGAELILPEIIQRNQKDIAIIIPDSKGISRGLPLDYFYDKHYLNRTLSEICPQMKLFWSLDDLYNTPMGNPVTISVSEVGVPQISGSLMTAPREWKQKYQTLVDLKSNPKTRTWPFKVIVGTSTYVWPTLYDPTAFVKDFGRILRFRQDVRQLAASAFHTMQKSWIRTPNLGSIPGSEGSTGFVGVHLRIEKDVQGAGDFPIYDEQAAFYLDCILQSPYRIAYLASGATSEDIAAFIDQARESNVTVLTKNDLLEPDELSYLRGLTWDQQALVDYELLLRANLMAGVSASSFAWSIALRRAANVGRVGGHGSLNISHHVRWQDERSVIMGKSAISNQNMQYGIWP